MKLRSLLLSAALAFLHPLGSVRVLGQIPSGSTGIDGDLVVPPGQLMTVELPPDGVLNYRTVRVSAGSMLRFRPNALNTPVYLLATGRVDIEGTVNVDGGSGTALLAGEAGPGGFAGGAPGIAGGAPGRGLGPGGGDPGANQNAADGAGGGSYSTRPVPPLALSTRSGREYGTPFPVPLVGGSGGGGAPGQGGGGGGGAILIASGATIRLTGTVSANGGVGNWAYGSGGMVRLLAFRVEGGGIVRVGGQAWGGWGRARIDLVDRSGLALNFNSAPAAAISVGALTEARPVEPRIELRELTGPGVGGNAVRVVIPQDRPFEYILPFNAAPDNQLGLRTVGFNGPVDIMVALIPDSGSATLIPVTVPALTTVAVPVRLSPNVPIRIQAWTR